jgi:alkaline phosphatase D
LRKFRLYFLLLLAAASLFGQSAPSGSAASRQDKPYVLLVSFDSFRYDYAKKYGAPNLVALGKKGVAAKALIPSFPSSTFPNHYTIVTGLTPAHHGIVANTFYDPGLDASFNVQNAEKNGIFFGGTPLWVLAEQQGMKTASFFWPGTEAPIQGLQPTYWKLFDAKITGEARVSQVIDWFRLPPAERPHFVTLYFDELDTVSHKYGPDSDETHEAVGRMDVLLGKLLAGIRSTGLPVNVFVVSDHGMTNIEGYVNVFKMTEGMTGVRVATSTTMASFYSKDRAALEKAYAALKDKDPRLAVYWRDETPEHLQFRGNPRIGDFVMLAKTPINTYYLTGERTAAPSKGAHGYDPAQYPEMQGIFYAEGPDLRSGTVLEPFQNTNIYPLIAKILGLRAPVDIDGSLKVLAPILRKK